MQELSLETIGSLQADLDIFRPDRPVRPELLCSGLHPPLPICHPYLIWGFHLLRAAHENGLHSLPCLALAGLSPADMLATALQIENRAGALLWSEKERMLRFSRGAERRGSGFSLSSLSQLIEGHNEPQLSERIEQFSLLPEAWREMVDEGLLDLKTALRAQGLPAEVSAALKCSRLSFSERRSFLLQLMETAGKRKLEPTEVVALAGSALAAKQPLKALAEWRAPVLAGMNRRWGELEAQLTKGTGVRITPPPCFEGDGFTVSFTFRSRQSLSRKIQSLARIGERCDELFDFLR